MTYTLTLLGTDTRFTPHRVDNEYDRVETLSYVSTLIHGTASDVDDVIGHRNENVAVVDGPTTYGSEVGDRIARGVQAVLEAISRGETNINIIAHSRGAVEAILVAHELERIQTQLLGDVNSPDVTNSACQYTKAAMNGVHKKAFDKLDRQAIAKHIGSVKISMFNIDPVPGGNLVGVTYVSSLAWRDERFYTVPKIVKEYEQYTYENERTRCFKAIVPKCASSDTLFKLHSLPGHHGTGSGNLLDQQRGKNPTQKKTEHVQELVVVKIIDFLTRNGVTITPRLAENDPFAHLITELYGASDGSEKITPFSDKLQNVYFKLYDEILKNKEAYEHYNNTSYAFLGQENAFLKLIVWVAEQRIVHYQAHNDTHLEDIVPPVAGKHFLNYEHARLKLNHELGLKSSNTLPETITSAITKLLTICTHAKKIQDLKDSHELKKNKLPQVEDLSKSVTEDTVAKAIITKDGFNLLLESLGLLIEDVRNAYLQGRVTKDERGTLYAAVKSAFDNFKEYTKKEPSNQLAKDILTTFNNHLETMLDTKRKALEGHYAALSAQLKDKSFFTVLLNQVQQISDSLDSQDDSTTLLQEKLNQFLTAAKKLSSSTSKIGEIKSCIEEARASFLPEENSLVPDAVNELRSTLSLLMDEALDDCVSYDIENIMREVVKAYEGLDSFSKDLPTFKALYDGVDYDQWTNELEKNRVHMVHLAAAYIAREQLDLEQEILPLLADTKPSLYKQIEGLAISYGAKNPLAVRLSVEQSEKERLDVALAQLVTAKQEMETQLSEKNNALELHLKKLTEAQELLISDKDALGEQKKELEEKLEQLQQEHSTLETVLSLEQTRLKTELQHKQQLEVQLQTHKYAHTLDLEQATVFQQKQDSVIEQLTESTEKQAKMIIDLDGAIAEKELIIQDLKNSDAEKEKLIQSITGSEAEQKRIVAELTETKEEQDRLMQLLTQEKDDLETKNNALEEKLRQQKITMEEILGNETQFKCQEIITYKLLPLTKKYLMHLAKEIDSSLNTDDLPNLISTIQKTPAETLDEHSRQLRVKFDKVSELYQTLTAKYDVLIPSEKIVTFKQQLHEADEAIKLHRDSAWKRYTTNALTILGIIVTGILPGLAILAIASKVRGTSMKFWASSGQTFFNASEEEAAACIPRASPNIPTK